MRSIRSTLSASLMLLTLLSFALAAPGCTAPVAPATTQPSLAATTTQPVTTVLKSNAVAFLGVAEQDGIGFISQWGPQWLAAGLELSAAKASGNAAQIAQANADLANLKERTLAAARQLGVTASDQAIQTFVQTFIQSFIPRQ